MLRVRRCARRISGALLRTCSNVGVDGWTIVHLEYQSVAPETVRLARAEVLPPTYRRCSRRACRSLTPHLAPAAERRYVGRTREYARSLLHDHDGSHLDGLRVAPQSE